MGSHRRSRGSRRKSRACKRHGSTCSRRSKAVSLRKSMSRRTHPRTRASGPRRSPKMKYRASKVHEQQREMNAYEEALKSDPTKSHDPRSSSSVDTYKIEEMRKQVKLQTEKIRIKDAIKGCVVQSTMMTMMKMMEVNELFIEYKLLFHSPFYVARREKSDYVTPNIVAHWNVTLQGTLPMISTTMVNVKSAKVAAFVGVLFDIDDASNVFVHMLGGDNDLMFPNPGSSKALDIEFPWDFHSNTLKPAGTNLQSAIERVAFTDDRGKYYNDIYQRKPTLSKPSEEAELATIPQLGIVKTGSFNEAVISAYVSGIKAVVCMRIPTPEDMENMNDLGCALGVECLYFDGQSFRALDDKDR